MEIDHIFICVKPGGPEAEALAEFGLTEGSANRHLGQGTANRRFFFHNAFIELLWLEDSEEAQNQVTKPTNLFERLTSEDQEVSPFGICFRSTNTEDKKAPFASWSYKPAYLPSNLAVEIGDAPLSEPMWFFLPFGLRPDSVPPEKHQPLIHQKGFIEITSVHITLPKLEELSVPATCATNFTSVEIIEGKNHLLEVRFDSQVSLCGQDFHPVLPIVFRW